jgi:hypothetical protein
LDGIDLAQALSPDGAPFREEFPANPLGDFQIVRELGRGGMGIVYEAIHLSLGRRVALKVLPFAAGFDPRQLQRFRTEAQAAAHLHHSNIVPVHAVGTERGVHFYEMQLIEGRSLDAVIREAREQAQAGQPVRRDRSALAVLAKLAADVADALQYAHDRGIIHRDIKPANLLIDADGVVWVTDFGLAQVTTSVSLTRTGDLVGTLRYMSPEQAAGSREPIDHRSDIYSLGATLYEAITLEPVFSGNERQGLLNHILHSEPRPPRQIVPTLPAEIDTILLKSLEKLPGDRYESAGEMALDLRRYIEGRPILARPPSLLDRGNKWLRRHPKGVAAALLALVAASIALAVTTATVAAAEARTRQALDRERERGRVAEERFRLARRAADDMIAVAEEEMAGNPFLENIRKRLLELALTYYQQFLEEEARSQTSQEGIAATRDRITVILHDLAILQGDRQIHLLREAAVLDDLGLEPERRHALASTLDQIDAARFQQFHDITRLTPEERNRRFVDMARKNDATLAAFLDPKQYVRLAEIALQCRRASAFEDPGIAAALELTPEQRETIRSLGWALRSRSDPAPRGRRAFPAPWENLSGSASVEDVLAILSPAQFARWKEMTGEEYTGRVPNPFPFPFPKRMPEKSR